jgi:hypothetical protein
MRLPEYRGWYERLVAIRGCEDPVPLRGRTTVVDTVTGDTVSVFDSAELPFGVLLVPCGNRRASRCAPCARVYQGDTYQLARAGLAGGKGVPESVAEHPMAFVTFTAPSFGAVHERKVRGGVVGSCHPEGSRCGHVGCGRVHGEDDPALGTPLCAACYDYEGAVLWNALCPRLWHHGTDVLRRVALPQVCGYGMRKKEFADQVKVSFFKVAEFQRRGMVHFHAIVRLDGPGGACDAPPPWASVERLIEAVALMMENELPHVESRPGPGGGGRYRDMKFGRVYEAHPIVAGDERLGEGIGLGAAASYVAKYATKAAECVGVLDRKITCSRCGGTGFMGACHGCGGSGLAVEFGELPVSEHARALMETAWRLGAVPAYRDLKLRNWAHQCGFGGHFATKSRLYSTTMGALRAARAEYASGGAQALAGRDVVAVREWHYAGKRNSPVEAEIGSWVRELLEEQAWIARDALGLLRAEDEAMREAAEADPEYGFGRGGDA